MPETRYEQWKRYLFYITLVFFLILPILAYSVGPSYYRSRIDKENPAGQKVSEFGTRDMYRLGRFYAFTMRDEEAGKIYQELIDDWWQDKDRDVPDDDVWVGLAMYYYGELLYTTLHRQKAVEHWEEYLRYFADNPQMDPNLVQNARNRVRGYHGGH